MANEQTLTTNQAIECITVAQKEAERDMTKTELRNLYVMAEAVKSELVGDVRNT